MKINLKVTITILLCISGFMYAQEKSKVTDHLIFSENLQEHRLISVALPVNYQDSDKKFPVLYVLDAEYVFDYARGAVSFLSNPFGYLPEIIVVGIPNTDRYRDLYVSFKEDGGYVNFLNFIEKDLVPYINKNYRSNGFDIIYGWSSGSGIGSYFFAKTPGLFDAYILSGTGIGPKTEAFMNKYIPQNNYNGTFLYANVEGEGPRVKGHHRFSALIKNLNPKGLIRKFDISENTNHVEVLSKGLYDGLRFVFSDFYIPDSITVQGTQSIIDYYNKIDDYFSFDVSIPLGAINESATVLLSHNKPDEAIKLLRFGASLYANRPDLYGTLGEFYEFEGDSVQAARYYQKALERASGTSDHLKFSSLLLKIGK